MFFNVNGLRVNILNAHIIEYCTNTHRCIELHFTQKPQDIEDEFDCDHCTVGVDFHVQNDMVISIIDTHPKFAQLKKAIEDATI